MRLLRNYIGNFPHYCPFRTLSILLCEAETVYGQYHNPRHFIFHYCLMFCTFISYSYTFVILRVFSLSTLLFLYQICDAIRMKTNDDIWRKDICVVSWFMFLAYCVCNKPSWIIQKFQILSQKFASRLSKLFIFQEKYFWISCLFLYFQRMTNLRFN